MNEKEIRRQKVRADHNRFVVGLTMIASGHTNKAVVERLLNEAGLQAGSGKAMAPKSLAGFVSKCRTMVNAYNGVGKLGAVWQNMQRLKEGKDVLSSCTYKSYVRSGCKVLDNFYQNLSKKSK